jgi:hypothetical protein
MENIGKKGVMNHADLAEISTLTNLILHNQVGLQ